MARNGTVDRIESAANITLVVSRGASRGADSFQEETEENQTGNIETTQEEQPSGYIQVPISRLDTTKEVEVSEIRESSLKASGYSITSISYSGTMMFKGSHMTKEVPDSSGDSKDGATKTKSVNDFLYKVNGVPQPVSINIDHTLPDNNEMEHYQHVLTTSESYEVRSEQETETAYDWVAMDRASDQPKQG